MEIPKYLEEMIEQRYEGGMLREIILRTPSAQMWDSLSVEQQGKWKKLVQELGANPEDYLRHSRSMLPGNPPGK